MSVFNHTLLRTLHAKILSTNLMFNNLSQCQIQIHLAFPKQFEVAAASRHCFGLQSVGELKFYQPRLKPHCTHRGSCSCHLNSLMDKEVIKL